MRFVYGPASTSALNLICHKHPVTRAWAAGNQHLVGAALNVYSKSPCSSTWVWMMPGHLWNPRTSLTLEQGTVCSSQPNITKVAKQERIISLKGPFKAVITGESSTWSCRTGKCSDLSNTDLEAAARASNNSKKIIKNKQSKAAKLPYKTLKLQIRVSTEEYNIF